MERVWSLFTAWESLEHLAVRRRRLVPAERGHPPRCSGLLTVVPRSPRADTHTRVMSWQAYVDANLIASGMVSAGGIYDLQGNPWAYSAGFAVRFPPRSTLLLEWITQLLPTCMSLLPHVRTLFQPCILRPRP